ncbi:MAG: endonuclease III [Bacilli bacterium]|nr:endonuclease III [Bacilli bacterium]
MKSSFYEYLDYYIPNPKCELNYSTDYELLIATVLSAQCTDKRVNEVTKILFKYNLEEISLMSFDDIEKIIRSCGSYTKKAVYVKNIADILLHDYNGKVPNSREILETFPGVGPKTCSVVLKNIYNVPAIPVDTHVERVCKRLGIVFNNATPRDVEEILKNEIPVDKWNRVSEQILLFGRYYCRAINPKCDNCLFKDFCKYKRN